MRKKYVFIIVIGVFVLVAGVGIYLYNKPHTDIQKAKPEVNITANELFTSYNTNESAANEKYLGKIIQVTGEIASIESGEHSMTVWLYDPLSGVSCSIDSLTYSQNKGYLSGLHPGKEITLKGKCDGMLTDVVLTRCVPVMSK